MPKRRNAEFTVTPGTLSLNQVPNIMLGTVSVKDIATANTTVPVTSGAPTSGTAYDGNNTGTLNVTDFRVPNLRNAHGRKCLVNDCF